MSNDVMMIHDESSLCNRIDLTCSSNTGQIVESHHSKIRQNGVVGSPLSSVLNRMEAKIHQGKLCCENTLFDFVTP